MRLALTTMAFVFAACAPNPGIISFVKFFDFETQTTACGLPNDVDNAAQRVRGDLDVSIYEPEFNVGVAFRSDTITQNEVSNERAVLENANRDLPVVTQFTYTYRLLRQGRDVTPAVAKGKKFTKPTSFFFNKVGLALGPDNLIVPEVATTLFASIDTVDKAVDAYDLRVGFEASGKLAKSGTPVSTGPVEFPIRIFNVSTRTCMKPQRIVATGVNPTGACTYTGQMYPVPPPCCDGVNPVPVGCDYTP